MSVLSVVRPVFILLLIIIQCYCSRGQQMSSSRLVLPEKQFKVPFIWKGDSVNGQWEQYAAMLIPVKLAGCPKQFYMQFDVGAPNSLFYKNKLQAINSRYRLPVQVTDSGVTCKQIGFSAGKTKILAREIMLRQLGDPQINWNNTAIEIIGTLGADLIDNRTVLINYPGREISIGYTIPKNAGLTLTDFIYANRSIILPALIKDRKTMLYFDSGSSAFELLTNKETAIMLALPGTPPVSYPVTSWGKILTANSFVSKDSIEIAAVKMPLNRVTYIEGVSDTQVSRMMKMGIGGMTGNKLFIHSMLVLDIKNKRFGILNGGY
jgi:hypothetical protein